MTPNWKKLPEDSYRALYTSAELGYEFSLAELYQCGFSHEEVDPLFDEELVRETGHARGVFVSEALWKEVRAIIPRSIKREVNRKIAEVLASRDPQDERIARHCVTSGDFAGARRFLLNTAERKYEEHRYDTTLKQLCEALESWPFNEDLDQRREAVRRVSRCIIHISDEDLKEKGLGLLAEAAEKMEDSCFRLELRRMLAEHASRMGNRTELKNQLQLAAELASQSGDSACEATQWYALGGFLLGIVRLKSAMEAVDRAYEAAGRSGNTALIADILSTKALTHAMLGEFDTAFARIDEAMQMAIDHELHDVVTIVYRRLANVYEYSSNYEDYVRNEVKALDRCKLNNKGDLELACVSCLSYAHFRLGEWKKSQDMIHTVLNVMKLEDERMVIAHVVKACIAAFRGERKLANQLYRESILVTASFNAVYMEFSLHWAYGAMAYIDGDTKKAEAVFENLLDLWEETDDLHDAVPGLLFAGSFFADQSNQPRLSHCLNVLSKIVESTDNPETLAAQLALMAENCWVSGKAEQAVNHCLKALEGYQRLSNPMETIHVARRLGLMQASKNDLADAFENFRLAEDFARQLGMRPFLALLEKDRERLGFLDDSKSTSQLGGLTRRQVEVLRELVGGLSNKEAAAKLNLSPRTVEMHVAGILERLNCRGRTEAIKIALGSGLV